ncbi:hypothetical protein E8P82_06755 [Arthrobacter echini]|uniref:WxL domain-containing protein n=1 Tax=Arthrobacter echini TaxID=1529066 RepID=A0A4S5E6P7_9MICC|nr:hypothetical protein [Arthrobacter echini]THJ67130.1 hypothetical protein E8P82_06755 [Arthrobacter echini]
MKTMSVVGRVSAVGFGAVLLAAAGTAIAAADEDYGSSDVDVRVEVPAIETPGVLALTIDSEGTAVLEESGSTDLVRQFTGTLPAVTVSDTRDPQDIQDGAVWYVLGTATDFVGDEGQADIPAANLGWDPQILTDDSDGLVFAGEEVETVIDGGEGLGPEADDAELFASTIDSRATAPGAWTANASLFLRTTPDVAPGSYASTITLSLFE